jgi:hypothetical protein
MHRVSLACMMVLVAGLAAVLWAVSGALGGTKGSTARSFGDGTHVVGNEIRPGTYRAQGADGCYWARLHNFSGGVNSILANDNAAGPAVVTILSTDKGFESDGCGTWTSNLSRITKSTRTFGQGTHIVGVDIAPGTYRSRGGDGCYWERLRDFTGGLNSILANDNVTGSTIVTISRADKGFESSSCAAWTRI